MKVWLVEGDDRDYDWGSQWIVGIYETEEKARTAADEDLKRYRREQYGSAFVDYTVNEVEVL